MMLAILESSVTATSLLLNEILDLQQLNFVDNAHRAAIKAELLLDGASTSIICFPSYFYA